MKPDPKKIASKPEAPRKPDRHQGRVRFDFGVLLALNVAIEPHRGPLPKDAALLTLIGGSRLATLARWIIYLNLEVAQIVSRHPIHQVPAAGARNEPGFASVPRVDPRRFRAGREARSKWRRPGNWNVFNPHIAPRG